MRRFLLIVLMGSASLGMAQERSFLNLDQRANWDRSFVELSPEFSMAGQGLNNRFLLEFMTSDTLSREARADQLKALNDNNRLGVDYDLSIRAKLKINTKFSALIKLSDRLHLDAQFPSDAFSLAFSGNKAFAGDTANLSGLGYNLLRYQQLGVGLQWNASPAFSLFVLPSLLKGEQFQSLALENGWLYTSSIGDSLTLQGKGRYTQSDSGNIGLAAANGWGASLTFGTQFVASGAKSDWSIDFLVKDLGWIGWNNRSIKYDTDTTIEWTGVEIENFENLGDSSASGFDADSLTDAFLGAIENGSQQTLLPGYVQLQVRQLRDRGWVSGMGIILRWRANFRPYAWVQSGYQFNPKLSALAYLAYGGYAGVQFGLGGSYYGESVMVSLQLQNIESTLFAAQQAGFGARLSLGYRF